MVSKPLWSPDGKIISVLYDGTLNKEKPKAPDPMVEDAVLHFNRVWLVNVTTREIRPITPEKLHVFEYAWSPDGAKLVLVASPHPNSAEGWYHAQLYITKVAKGETQQIGTQSLQIGLPGWSPDSQSIAYIAGVLSDQGYVGGEVFVIPTEGGEAYSVTPRIDHTITWIEWRPEGILYGARHIDQTLLGWIDPAAKTTHLIRSCAASINSSLEQRVSIAQDGKTFATILVSFAATPDVFLGSLDNGDWRQLTHIFRDSDVPLPLHVESIQWSASDGTAIQGFLTYPRNYTSGNRYPLLVYIHGGPSASFVPIYGLGAGSWHRLMAERGCFTLMANPRGSWGRGHAFQAANVGDLGGGDWQDINAGVDHLIARGFVDPDRLAVSGWSYGGYLTAWAITQTDRFRCAIAGAPITNYESNYGVVSIREWQTILFGTHVYDDPALHRERSPLTHVKRIKTPTLLLHGECDIDVPVQQSTEFYIALKHFGVPTELVIYPREPHEFHERAHQLDMLQRIDAWIGRYLLA